MDQALKVLTASELGEAVELARKAQGLTQQELADRIGVGRMTLVRLENGAGVSIDTVTRALAECGQALAVVPKFAVVRIAETQPDNGAT
ncbi:helix-turn-helix transcriptional regulator [Nocardioides sp. Bht2]|uniref:helix-turn-helix transcriptional regulator n=1 Tax=Nocardioides sp. Bht2 TaxID=3392297 RepID=UPI0039B4D9CE